MTRRIPWKPLTIGGAALASVAGLIALTRRSSSPSHQRVALIGDSYAVGLGPEIAKLLPDFRYEGHVGTNTSQWVRHAKDCGQCGDWLTTFAPAVVLVSLGVNDGAAPNRANYQTIVRALQKIGARVVWIEPPAAVNTPARAIIASLGVQTIPGTTVPLAADGLHPRSYSTWAREVAQAIS